MCFFGFQNMASLNNSISGFNLLIIIIINIVIIIIILLLLLLLSLLLLLLSLLLLLLLASTCQSFVRDIHLGTNKLFSFSQ